MEDKKSCVRCNRLIDPYARICPYCNWDQSSAAPPPPAEPAVAQVDAYTPPTERNWRRHLLMVGGIALLLISSFFVGAVINRDDAAPADAPEPVLDKAAEDSGIPRTRRADVRLVPMNDPAAADLPITSAPVAEPAEGIPTEYQRRDATAVSSVEYAALAKRAEAERRANQELVDPRSITGPAYAEGQRQQQAAAAPGTAEPMPPPMTSASAESAPETSSRPAESRREPAREPARVVERTRPVPQSQPLPRISVDQPVTARLQLTVGADGRVKQVRIRKSLPGHTPELIAAVQRWRFKPATENGVPVSAPFTVDISFNP